MNFAGTESHCTVFHDNVWCVQETEDEPFISSEKKKGLPDSFGSSASIRTSIFHGDGAEADDGDEETKGNHGLASNCQIFVHEKTVGGKL